LFEDKPNEFRCISVTVGVQEFVGPKGTSMDIQQKLIILFDESPTVSSVTECIALPESAKPLNAIKFIAKIFAKVKCTAAELHMAMLELYGKGI
jgi:hypothetical protein